VMPFRSVPNGRAFVDSQAAPAKEMVVCSAFGADSVVGAKSRFHSLTGQTEGILC
jgi:hypothetical protein